MQKQVVFRTSAFGGFEKKAVLDYIYELNESAEEAQAQLEEKIGEVTQARQELENTLKKTREEMHALQSKYNGVLTELDGERARVGELTDLVATLNTRINEQDAIIEKQTAEVRALSQRNSEMEKMRGDVETASAQIGRLLIDARADADKILSKAKEDANVERSKVKQKTDLILAEAQKEAETRITDATEQSNRMVDEANQAVDLAHEQFSLFRSEISDLQRVILSSLEQMQEKTAAISSVIDTAQQNMLNGRTPLSVEFRPVAVVAAAPEPSTDTPDEKDDLPEYGDFFR